MATDVAWLQERMDEAEMDVPTLAKKSGVSAAGIRQILKRGSCRDSTAQKLQAVFDERIGPRTSVKEAQAKKEGVEYYNLMNLPPVEEEDCLRRFKGKECDVLSATCSACYETLRELDLPKPLPITRGQCKIEHGWGLDGGVMYFKGA